MVDDEPNVGDRGLDRALPRVAEEPRLIVGRQRLGFADVNLRRPEPQRGVDDRLEHVDGGDDHQTYGAMLALGDGNHRREQPPLVVGRARIDRRIVGHVDADEPHGHRDHVAIARLAQRSRQVRQRVRLAHRHEKIPPTRLHVAQVHVVGGQELEGIESGGVRRRRGRRRAGRHRQHRGERGDDGQPGDRGRIDDEEEAADRSGEQHAGCDQADRPLDAAHAEVDRRPVGARFAPDEAVAKAVGRASPLLGPVPPR